MHNGEVVVAHSCNLRTQEAKPKDPPQLRGLSRLHSKTLSQKKKERVYRVQYCSSNVKLTFL